MFHLLSIGNIMEEKYQYFLKASKLLSNVLNRTKFSQCQYEITVLQAFLVCLYLYKVGCQEKSGKSVLILQLHLQVLLNVK